ncbi:MAG: hypothetical protein U1E26_12790 [Coriobacteriia bacterium]|nr:hypothetical protein [bacterium]MDZ4170509.1 hypothetical protein [Coriobacteriia bacterium]
MDVWKVVIILLVVALVLIFVGKITGVITNAGTGSTALTVLNTPGKTSTGVPADWSPVSVGSELFAGLFGTWLLADGVVFDIWGAMIAAFLSALVVLGAALAIRFITKVVG